MGMVYITNCVNSTCERISPMVERARDITRRTFLQHVDRRSLAEVEQSLGYEAHPSRGLTMAGDHYVSYHRSTFCGKPCVFFSWSGIEYIFQTRHA